MLVMLKPLSSLLISSFILTLGLGLVSILLPVRMGIEAMSIDTIGLVLSMYAVGMLFGGLYSKALIIRAGHIRVFSTSASLACICVLASALYNEAWFWGLLRGVMGFCVACTFATIDGWLSGASSKETRGRVLACSQTVVLVAQFSGQLMLNLANPAGESLFILAGILFCLAIIPLSVSRSEGPRLDGVGSVSLQILFRFSPLGVVSCFFAGVLFSSLLNMLPVFAGGLGLDSFSISLVMSFAVFGAFVMQLPVGFLADRFDRRTVIFWLLVLTIIASAMVPFLVAADNLWVMMFAVAIVTGAFACLYPLSVSETLDRVRSKDIASVMGRLITVFALGSIVGPYSSSLMMKILGYNALFGFLAIFETLLLAFVIYRMRVREALPVELQDSFVMQGVVASTMIGLDPRI